MRKLAPVVGLGVLSLCDTAFAQGERRIDVGATVVNSYETNLLRLPGDVPAPPGQSRSDIRATPSVTIDLAMPVGGQSVFVSGIAGYDFYAQNKSLERERIQVSGGANLNFRTCGSTLTASYERQQSNLADILPGEPTENVQNSTSFDARVSCPGLFFLAPGFTYSRARVVNGDPARRNGNSTTETFGLTLNFSRPALGDLGANLSYADGRFDEAPDAVTGLRNRIRTINAGLNFTRSIGSQLTGFASASLSKVNPELPGVPGYRGLTWSADLTWTPGTRFQINGGFSRQVQLPNLLDVSYSINDTLRGQVNYALGNRIQLSAGATATRRSLRDSAATPGAVLASDDRTFALNGSGSMALGKRLSLSINAAAERRRSDFDDFDYNNFSVALTTRLTI